MNESLRLLSEQRLAEIRDGIVANAVRYRDGDFKDLAEQNGWAVEARTVQVDGDVIAHLDGSARTADADVVNAQILHSSLIGMTPALAREERIWVRLTHVECLDIVDRGGYPLRMMPV